MTKNNIDQGFNTSNKFISILCDNFVIDIQVQFNCFYGEILKLKNNGKFEKVFENLKTLINKKYLEKKMYFSILLTDDKEITKINNKSRNKPYPTNVLSFPSLDFKKNKLRDNIFSNEIFFGDIVISIERILSEASKENKRVNDHFLHIFVHGLLHLIGFDHETDEEANFMELTEIEILNSLDIKNPY